MIHHCDGRDSQDQHFGVSVLRSESSTLLRAVGPQLFADVPCFSFGFVLEPLFLLEAPFFNVSSKLLWASFINSARSHTAIHSSKSSLNSSFSFRAPSTCSLWPWHCQNFHLVFVVEILCHVLFFTDQQPDLMHNLRLVHPFRFFPFWLLRTRGCSSYFSRELWLSPSAQRSSDHHLFCLCSSLFPPSLMSLAFPSSRQLSSFFSSEVDGDFRPKFSL